LVETRFSPDALVWVGRCLLRYRRLAEPRSDHFPAFVLSNICPAAPPGGGLRPPGRPPVAWASPRRAPPAYAAGSPGWARGDAQCGRPPQLPPSPLPPRRPPETQPGPAAPDPRSPPRPADPRHARHSGHAKPMRECQSGRQAAVAASWYTTMRGSRRPARTMPAVMIDACGPRSPDSHRVVWGLTSWPPAPLRAFLRFPVCPPGPSPSPAFPWFPVLRRSPVRPLRPLPGFRFPSGFPSAGNAHASAAARRSRSRGARAAGTKGTSSAPAPLARIARSARTAYVSGIRRRRAPRPCRYRADHRVH
jgi:hypothetical protein